MTNEAERDGWKARTPLRLLRTAVLLLALPLIASAQQPGGEEDEDWIDPTRPTVLESATVPRPGVLQLEYGVTDYSGRNADGSRSTPLGIRFAPNRRIRLDFDIDPITSGLNNVPGGGSRRETGIGDTSLAAKYVFRVDPERQVAVALSYSTVLPTASVERGLGNGRVDHNLRLIIQRTPGKNDFVFNSSYLNVGRADSTRRASGAQAVLAYGRELPRNFGFTGEVYGQTVDEAAGNRGAYAQGIVTYKVNRRLRFDTGVRFGIGNGTERVGFVGGLVVGLADLFGGSRSAGRTGR